jgi:hypothetical protein
MGTQQGTKKRSRKLQDKFTKEFENLANKILEEKSNKFTEQGKHEEHPVSFAGKDSFIRKKSRRYAQRKHRLPCSFAPTF